MDFRGLRRKASRTVSILAAVTGFLPLPFLSNCKLCHFLSFHSFIVARRTNTQIAIPAETWRVSLTENQNLSILAFLV